MWELLPRKYQLTTIVLVTLLFVWSYDTIQVLLHKETPTIWKMTTLAVTVIGTIFVGISEFCWRWVWRKIPWLQRKIFPDLNGEWKGNLVSTWKDPATGQSPPPISTNITIRQGIFSTVVCLSTGESESTSGRVRLARLTNVGRFRLWYDYRNGPKQAVRDRSAPHNGFAYLEVSAGNLDHLTGQYYTDRKTSGDIEVDRE